MDTSTGMKTSTKVWIAVISAVAVAAIIGLVIYFRNSNSGLIINSSAQKYCYTDSKSTALCKDVGLTTPKQVDTNIRKINTTTGLTCSVDNNNNLKCSKDLAHWSTLAKNVKDFDTNGVNLCYLDVTSKITYCTDTTKIDLTGSIDYTAYKTPAFNWTNLSGSADFIALNNQNIFAINDQNTLYMNNFQNTGYVNVVDQKTGAPITLKQIDATNNNLYGITTAGLPVSSSAPTYTTPKTTFTPITGVTSPQQISVSDNIGTSCYLDTNNMLFCSTDNKTWISQDKNVYSNFSIA